jgi:amino acid transporter
MIAELAGIPWAGIGALLAGAGSLLSGLAAYRLATRGSPNEQEPPTRDGDR